MIILYRKLVLIKSMMPATQSGTIASLFYKAVILITILVLYINDLFFNLYTKIIETYFHITCKMKNKQKW